MTERQIDNRKNNIGKRVKRINGANGEGVLIKFFPWKESTDGTYSIPNNKDHVAVQWDNGTKGYECRKFLNIITNEKVQNAPKSS
jgi:hypothetical protein